MNKLEILKNYFGYKGFRPAQEKVIDEILSGRDVLAVMPTGAGKSICFQVPALMMNGITIVISPLISLMTDQVSSLVQSGIRAAYLNSTLSAAAQRKVTDNIRAGMYKIVYIAPERLDTEGFGRVAADIDISMVAVDEAHCISQWGQDFRPSYMNIIRFIGSLTKRPVVTAFTATATERVREDIVNSLEMKDPYCVTTGFDRPNLYFGVKTPDNKYEELKNLLSGYEGKSGIVYCSTRKNVDEVAFKLENDGFSAAPYHAGMADDMRMKNQDDFIYDRVRIIVATNAFGMGIDKSNVSFVIHYNMPKDMESYYQEAGRAGRDGEPADCIMLYSGADYRLAKYMIENSYGEGNVDEKTAELLKKRDLKRLSAITEYSQGTSCLRSYILNYFGEDSSGKCSNCSFCSGDTEKTDVTVEAQKIMSCIYRMGQSFGAAMVIKVLRGENDDRIREYNFSSLPTYGIMSDMSAGRIKDIIGRLTANGYLVRTDSDRPVLKLTAKAVPVLKGMESVYLMLPKEKPVKKNHLHIGETYALDSRLMEKLKQLRRSIAETLGIPPYQVFTDATLRDMCSKLPVNKGEFLAVSGVGKMKLERYGDDFIKVIADWKKQNGGVKLGEKEAAAVSEHPLHEIAKRLTEDIISDDDLTLSQYSDNIITASGMNFKTRGVRTAIGDWLIEKGLLCEKKDSKGMNCKAVTKLSESVGIVSRTKISARGVPYNTVVLTPEAQRFITEHFSEIASIED